MVKLILVASMLFLSGCDTPPINPPQSKIPESLLTRCSKLPKYSFYTTGKLVKDHMEYTEHVMELHTDCATSKDNLIEAVRINQK